ncbi:DUF1523 family protein [Limnobaculum zhutongyuii]|uniref:DUF1523 family protein n=1 Tax=Limnobaculum zhutongyuii TaxID=2498113 RepID=A0A411WK13_9GAMM|nr:MULTISPECIES: DUF1523 family protein [Limnobaculum]QBH96512.1 DUF1523 family protein [Limnobaculum zhutongyuii]TQS90457.1 DUF1523 family protein [Limnobaculum zhutongyuii]
MSLIKKIFIGYLVCFAIGTALLCSFYLPSTDIVKITGSEVKRVDNDGPISAENPADGPTRDVYYIYTINENKKIMVYRNEDTGWSFPWYFKFNSADIQAQAQSANDANQITRVVHYGWRFNMVHMFKNIISIKPVDGFDASGFSFYTVMKILGWIIWFVLIAIQAALPTVITNWRDRKDLKRPDGSIVK